MKYPDRMPKISLVLLSVFICCSSLFSQIDGDNIFGQDQVIDISLVFPEDVYWATLVANYNAGDNDYIWAELTLTDITGTTTLDSVGVRLKGNSSYSHPGNKKSFKIDFNKFVTGQDYDGLKKLNFSNGFKDPTCMREKIFSDVCIAAGVPAPRVGFANVTINGVAWGFYAVVEQIDDQFLDWSIENDDGNLFKAGDNFTMGIGTPADLEYYGTDQSIYEERYELKTNEDVNDWTDLIEFIDFINNSSDADFESEIGARLELQEFLRSAALDNLFSNLDSYTGSARNYYMYHNESSNRWEWIKWDGNEVFGSYTNGVAGMTTLALDYHNSDRPLLERIFSNDNLYEAYLTELCDIVNELFNSDVLDPRIEELKTLIQPSVFADNNKMYSNANFTTNIESNIGGMGTTYGLKSFIASKTAYVAGVIECSEYTAIDEYTDIQVSLYPNPARDMLTISSQEQGLKNICILDVQSRVIQTKQINGIGEIYLSLSDVTSGVFFVRFEMEDGSFQSKKLIIE